MQAQWTEVEVCEPEAGPAAPTARQLVIWLVVASEATTLPVGQAASGSARVRAASLSRRTGGEAVVEALALRREVVPVARAAVVVEDLAGLRRAVEPVARDRRVGAARALVPVQRAHVRCKCKCISASCRGGARRTLRRAAVVVEREAGRRRVARHLRAVVSVRAVDVVAACRRAARQVRVDRTAVRTALNSHHQFKSMALGGRG